MLSLYNTKSRSLESFDHTKDAPVTMYNCGPTVYGPAHIGNLRAYIMADTIRRALEWEGYEVRQVINITDVGHLVSDADEGEDKMLVAASREGKTAAEIAEFYTEQFYIDLDALHIEIDGTEFPKATDHIAEQIALITILEEKGFTYNTSDGVYFDTSKFPHYADFAHLDLEHMKEGARIGVIVEKRNPSDFALWKFSQSKDKRLQEWDSPWGTGFPGWHIECSAMSMKYLGETLDIHTGGIDHIPVHHTNEIAQSEAATGHEFVRYWLHSAFMTVDGAKMSKSLGNTYTLDDLAEKKVAPLAFRYWLLTGHYRSTLNFTWEAVTGAQSALERIYDFLRETTDVEDPKVKPLLEQRFNLWVPQFKLAIEDDLNSPHAIAILWSLMKDDAVSPADKRATLLEMDKVLGLGFAAVKKEVIPVEVQKIADEREGARVAKDFAKSDELRDEAKKLGWEIQDTPEGTKIKRL